MSEKTERSEAIERLKRLCADDGEAAWDALELVVNAMDAAEAQIKLHNEKDPPLNCANCEAPYSEPEDKASGLVEAVTQMMDMAGKMAASAMSGVTIEGRSVSKEQWAEWIENCKQAGIALSAYRGEQIGENDA